jgi:rare lipoprotein A
MRCRNFISIQSLPFRYLVLVRAAMHRFALIVAFLVLATSACATESGLASYYGGRGHGGEMTCAHRTRPFGSIVTVTGGGRSIQCRVNDRGPFVRGRVIDVSMSAARALGMMRSGVIRVSVE